MDKVLYYTSRVINVYKQRKQLAGYTTIFNVVEFPKSLDFNLKVIYPSKSDYTLAIKLSKDLLRIWKPIPAIDVVVSAIALNRDMTLVTSDAHFVAIKEIRSYFKYLHTNDC